MKIKINKIYIYSIFVKCPDILQWYIFTKQQGKCNTWSYIDVYTKIPLAAPPHKRDNNIQKIWKYKNVRSKFGENNNDDDDDDDNNKKKKKKNLKTHTHKYFF